MNWKLSALAVLLVAKVASAALIWDAGPLTGSYSGSWANEIHGQHFADTVLLGQDADIDGYVHYASAALATGSNYQISIYQDGGGQPGSLLQSFTVAAGPFSTVGTYGLYETVFNFSPIHLTGGQTYWWGAAGINFEGYQIGVGPGSMAQFSGANYSNMTSGTGDQMFQLLGSFSAVCEPGFLQLIARIMH